MTYITAYMDCILIMSLCMQKNRSSCRSWLDWSRRWCRPGHGLLLHCSFIAINVKKLSLLQLLLRMTAADSQNQTANTKQW